jgi:hypothetical protein
LQKNRILSPRIWFINIALSLFLFASSQHLNNSDATLTIPATKIKYAVYNNHSTGIKFLYPSGWEPILKKSSDSNTAVIEILFPNITGSSNTSGIHWHGPSTSFITLSIVNTSSPYNSTSPITTLNSLTKQNLNLANSTLPNFDLIESNKTTFANNPAYRIVYTFIDPSIKSTTIPQFQSMNVWTIKGDKIYTLSYSQPIQEYAIYLPVVQRIIDSLKITRG